MLKSSSLRLWFAQNSLPLWLKWQPVICINNTISSCDLLKIHYLCGWNDNVSVQDKSRTGVVICSKFITFVVEMTTKSLHLTAEDMLWFAQNSLPLWLKWQPIGELGDKSFSCDLLKIHYLCGWNDNKYQTIERGALLWFAQNSLPLWLKWQQPRLTDNIDKGCDLLKIHYLCGWNDNRLGYLMRQGVVVICSKFITFVVEMTTTCWMENQVKQLWFAQNSLPLWLKWQRREDFI